MYFKKLSVLLAFVISLATMNLPLTYASTHEAYDPSASQPMSAENLDLAPNAKSAILMDADTGTILYEKNSHDRLPPASITKVMTMLLVMEAIEQGTLRWDEKITVSEHAASMGGSQIFLHSGEQMTVEELMKGVAIASANDASVALAEKIAGTEQLFVEMMNEKAKQLGLQNTHFVNSNGLPHDDHYSSAYDIAIMSKELLSYEKVTDFTGKYQDYLRQDTKDPFWLVNTNKLVRFYDGVDGLKTGYTSVAKYCLSATAKRDNMRLIAVVLGEPSAKTRNLEISNMFDYAFSQYKTHVLFQKGDLIGTYEIDKGSVEEIEFVAERPIHLLLKKGHPIDNIRHEVIIDEKIALPIKKGDPIAKLKVSDGDEVLAEHMITSPVDVNKANWWTLFKRSTRALFTPNAS